MRAVARKGAGDTALFPGVVRHTHITTAFDKILDTILPYIIKDIISCVKEYGG